MEPLRSVHFRDIFPVFPSAFDSVSFPRANTPIGEGSFDWQTTESAPKNKVDRDYTMIDLSLKPLAGYSIVSRQSLRNLPFLQSWLPTSMTNGLLNQEDGYFGTQLYQAATGSSTTAGVTVAVERLIHFIKNLRKADHNPNVILVDPDIWATVLTTKPQDYSVPNCVTIDANGNVRILGRPVFEVNWLSGGRVLVGDTSKAGIIQSEGVTMRQSDSHGDTFIQNEITMLLEVTEALAVFRPDAFIATALS
jgi:HK97 family phage major capsid protein